MGMLEVTEKYALSKEDKEFECQHIFRTTDPKHPGVEKVMAQAGVNLAGRVTALSEGIYPKQYKGLYYRPAETRAIFADKGWSRVAAFQTRNPMHRSHEHLAKIAIEICDGLLIHQVLGALKPGDIPAEVRVKAIDKLTENYFVPGTYIQAGYPIEMRYAGPREALLHAVFRQNFGCSHLVIGRDHAGVGSYYGPFDAQHIFDTLPAGSLVTQPLKIDVTFYCYKCGGMATARTCPHGAEHRLEISGTKLRAMFAEGEKISRRVQPPRSGRSAAGILSRAEAVTQKIYITRSQQGGILRMPTFVHTEKCDGCKGGQVHRVHVCVPQRPDEARHHAHEGFQSGARAVLGVPMLRRRLARSRPSRFARSRTGCRWAAR